MCSDAGDVDTNPRINFRNWRERGVEGSGSTYGRRTSEVRTIVFVRTPARAPNRRTVIYESGHR